MPGDPLFCSTERQGKRESIYKRIYGPSLEMSHFNSAYILLTMIQSLQRKMEKVA